MNNVLGTDNGALAYMDSTKTDFNRSINSTPSTDEVNKISLSLIEHVYSQINFAIGTSLFCASIIFIGLYDSTKNNHRLFIWSALYISIALFRMLLSLRYSNDNCKIANLKWWRNLYVLGCFLGGASWGLAGILLFPSANSTQQTLLILMLAGVTSGSVPLSAAIPIAGKSFLVASILPFIVMILGLQNKIHYLFNITLTLYLIYTIILTSNFYKLIKKSIILKYENDILLMNLKISNKMLEDSATHDPLTNISNRRLFQTNLEAAIERAKIKKSIVGLFYFDLDHFKSANDTHGHNAGDFILKNVIYKLSVLFRQDDILARLGGDEFAIIIEDAKNRNELKSIAIKICQLLSVPIKMDGIELQISASIGISVYPDDGDTMEELVACADQRMFYAKRRGGNQYSFKSDNSIRVKNHTDND